jgi:hypothetical protein
MVGMAHIWPIVVQFGVGGVMCAIGVAAGLRSGYLDLKLPDDRKLMRMVAGGYVGLLLLSLAFTFWLPYVLPEHTR